MRIKHYTASLFRDGSHCPCNGAFTLTETQTETDTETETATLATVLNSIGLSVQYEHRTIFKGIDLLSLSVWMHRVVEVWVGLYKLLKCYSFEMSDF